MDMQAEIAVPAGTCQSCFSFHFPLEILCRSNLRQTSHNVIATFRDQHFFSFFLPCRGYAALLLAQCLCSLVNDDHAGARRWQQHAHGNALKT
jgi:hypothetical protein